MAAGAERRRAHGFADARVEELRVLLGGLGHDHGELVAADPAGDVDGAGRVAYALGRLREHAVAREVSDPVVDQLEVVEVEDDEGEISAVALRSQHLAPKRLVEVALIEEAREGIGLGELTGFPVASRVLDRRNRARGETLGAVDLVARRLPAGGSPEESERSQRTELASLHRHEEPASDQVPVAFLLRAVAVGHGDRPGGRPRTAGRWRTRRLLGRQPSRRDVWG